MKNITKAWLEVVEGSEMDAHLAANGQAEANAYLLTRLLRHLKLADGAKLLLPGIGTGQLFDYLDMAMLRKYDLICTDINQTFLSRAKARLQSSRHPKYSTIIDNLEESNLREPVAAAIVALVLEHIDWRKGIGSLIALSPKYLAFVIQRNEEVQSSFVTGTRDLPQSIRRFSEVATPTLLTERELTLHISNEGYERAEYCERGVADSKTMVGILYNRI